MEEARDPHRLIEIELLLDEALRVPEAQRAAWLAQTCPDSALRDEVEQLLQGHDSAMEYFDALEERLSAVAGVEAEAAGRLGRELGPYRIVDVIGAGGMGTVYLAERADGQFQQQVAVKVLSGGRARSEDVDRFRVERQILARIDHPDVARLLDGGVTDDGLPYLVMEHVRGRDLAAYCDEHRLSVVQRARLFARLGKAVQHLHRHLVVHRDVKPGNVLVTDEGHVKLLDFGIAKLLAASEQEPEANETLTRVLTPRYAAPEQIRGEPITTATDVYQLGAVLYELLAGRTPFEPEPGAPAHAVERAVLDEEPAPPSVAALRSGDRAAVEARAALRSTSPERLSRRLKGDLDAICLKALRKEPDHRYTSAEQLVDDLRRWLRGEPVIARRGTKWYHARKFLGRHRVGTTAAALVLGLSTAFGVIASAQAARLERERDRAASVVELLVDLFTVADPGQARGETVTAREVLDRGANRLRARLANQPELLADLLVTVGIVYRNLGLYDLSAPLLDEAVALRKSTEAPGALTATALSEWGELERLRGGLDSAEVALREAVELASGRGGDALVLARSLDRLGLVLLARGEPARADSVFRTALDLQTRAGPAPGPDLAETYQNLGAVDAARGDFDGAERRFRQALALRERSLGPDHPAVAATLNNLATILARLGTLEEAVPLQRRALASYRTLLPEDHPRIATILNNLGMMLYSRGEADAAVSFLRESEAIRRSRLGADHPELAQSLANLGLVLHELGAAEEAELRHQEALAIRLRAYGEDHPLVAQSLNNLALSSAARGDAMAADTLLTRSLEIIEGSLGPRHALFATGLHNLADVRGTLGDPAGAEDLYRRALDIRREALPEGHLDTAHTLHELGTLLVGRGQLERGLPLLREALAIRSEQLPEGHPHTAETENVLGLAASASANEGR